MTLEIDIIGMPEVKKPVGKYVVVELKNGKAHFHGIYKTLKAAGLEAGRRDRLIVKVLERSEA